jgi:hypothetical protein
MNFTLRPGTSADAERCGSICYEAFKAIADRDHFLKRLERSGTSGRAQAASSSARRLVAQR